MADKTDDLIISISTDLATVRRSLKKLESDIGGTADKVNRRFYTMGQQIDRAFAGVGQNVLRNLTGPLAGVAAVLSTREVLSYADAWTKAKNSLAVAGVVGAEQANVLERLYQSAQANAAPLGALAGLFGKAAQASDSLGASQEELLKFSDGVAVALRVAGTSATEAGGALTQLGQLLGSARVQAEEFNSVNEGARPILIAVAKGLDEAGGSVNKLKQLVNDGKVSGQQFFQAFLKGLPAIQAMAAGAAQTIEQGFTKVGNALTKYIGQTDESLSASQRLVAGLNALADNFGTVADVTLNLASIIAAAFLGRAIGPMIARLATTSTGLVATAVAMRGFEASILRAVVALRAGQIAAAGFKGALGFAGGSVGLAITALAVAFGYAATRTDEASRTADRYAEILKRVRDSADDAGGAAKGAGDSFVQAERNRLGKLVEEEAQSARNAAAEFEAAIDRIIASFSRRGGANSGIVADLKEIRGDLGDTSTDAASTRTALARVASANPDIAPLMAKLDAIIEKLFQARTNAEDAAAAIDRVGGGDLGLRQNNAATLAGYEKIVAAGKEFTSEAERRAALTKSQLALENQIAEVRRSLPDGTVISDAEIERIARLQLAGEASRGAEGKKQKEDPYSGLIASGRERIDQLEDETAMLGMTAQAAAAFGFEQDLLAEATRNQIALSPEQREAIHQLALEYGNVTAASEGARLAQDRLIDQLDAQRELFREVMGGVISDLRQSASGAEILANALGRVADKLADIALNSLTDGLFGAQGTSGGGLLGNLLGGIFGLGGGAGGSPAVSAAASFGSPLYDKGGYTGSGGKNEPAGVVHRGEYVFSKAAVDKIGSGKLDALHERLKGYASGGLVGAIPRSIPTPRLPSVAAVAGGNRSLTIAPTYSVDARGAQMNEKQFGAVLRQNNDDLVKQIKKAVPGWVVDYQQRFLG